MHTGAWAAAGLSVLAAALPGLAPAAERGRGVFEAKRCAHCHLPRGQEGVGPPEEVVRREQGALELAGRLWNHVPAMAAAHAGPGASWPRISADEMVDLLAYLRAEPGRDAAPDPARGRAVLDRKACLRCHSLRGQGGGPAPDLGASRPAYRSPAAWAAAVWAHAARMAARALERRVAYPRFAGDEMADLLGYLRTAAGASGR
jgi:cytochrome c551/c552